MKRFLAIFAMLTVFVPRQAVANFIQLTYTATVTNSSDNKTFEVSISVANSGDETATDVSVELPSLNERYAISAKIAAHAQAVAQFVLSAEQISAQRSGEYVVPFRVLYSDSADYKFSAPGILKLNIPPLPARAVGVVFHGLSDLGQIQVSKHEAVSVGLLNVSELPVSVDSVTPFSTGEFSVAVDTEQLPITLAANAEAPLRLKITNNSAIVGSKYPLYLIVRGVIGEKQYSVTELKEVLVVEGALQQRRILLIGIALFGFAIMAGYFFRRRSNAGRV